MYISLRFLFLCAVLRRNRFVDGDDSLNQADDYVAKCRTFLEARGYDRLQKLLDDGSTLFDAATTVGKMFVNGQIGAYKNNKGKYEVYLQSKTSELLNKVNTAFNESLTSSSKWPFQVILSLATSDTGNDGQHNITRVISDQLKVIDAVTGPSCETELTLGDPLYIMQRSCFEEAIRRRFNGGTSNRCLQKFIARYVDYAEPQMLIFIDEMGKYIFHEMNIYSFCVPIVKPNVTDIAKLLQDSRKSSASIIEALLLTRYPQNDPMMDEYWPDAVTKLAHATIGNKTVPYPATETAANYSKIGLKLHAGLSKNYPWFAYEVLVCPPAIKSTELCVRTTNNDTTSEGAYMNLGYLVVRYEKKRNASLHETWQRTREKESDIKRLFRMSKKGDNLCERINKINAQLLNLLISPNGFRSLAAVKCARKFVWYELAYLYFSGVWSSTGHYFIIGESDYDSTCVTIVLLP